MSAPSIPALGTLIGYSVTDAVGRVRLDTGEVLRFGRGAAKDFSPIEGIRALVTAVAPHPLGGLRVQSATLAPDPDTRAAYARMIDARDRPIRERRERERHESALRDKEHLRQQRARSSARLAEPRRLDEAHWVQQSNTAWNAANADVPRAAMLFPHATGDAGSARSYLGGRPDVSLDRWPRDPSGHSMAFFARVSLSDLSPQLVSQLGLPGAGAMLFFAAAGLTGDCCVIHVPNADTDALQLTEAPPDVELFDTATLRLIELPAAEASRRGAALDLPVGVELPRHRIGGRADPMQTEPDELPFLGRNEKRRGSTPLLLLQIDNDPIATDLGDARIYFWVRSSGRERLRYAWATIDMM